jgi:hypothetical protein
VLAQISLGLQAFVFGAGLVLATCYLWSVPITRRVVWGAVTVGILFAIFV